jgi:hypothetical protein
MDANMLVVALVVVLCLVVAAMWLRSRQDLSIGPGRPRTDTRQACCQCQEPRSWWALEWINCPDCNAAYCSTCRGWLWTSAARGWTAECLECGYEWDVPDE